MSPLNIAIISDTLPKDTGSGGRIAIYGLINLLKQMGHKVKVFMTPDRYIANSRDADLQVFDKDFGKNPIDLVWLFNLSTWKYFEPFSTRYPFIVYCFEPLHKLMYLHLKFNDIYHQGRGYYFRRILKLLEIEITRCRELQYLRNASHNGIVTAFAPNVQHYWSKALHRDPILLQLPYPDFGLRKNRYGSSDGPALLLGNMNSIHTRYGLNFFFKQVWPKINPPSILILSIHVVGGGDLPANFPKPTKLAQLVWKGFVPDIEAEWEKARYLLVPVPISDGVRSRILEAWCRGVPVIAHPAAEQGLPMMKPGVNYISAENPADWIAELSKRRELTDVERLVVEGRQAYEKHFSFEALSSTYTNVINMALK